ncbi:hypothetical protein BRADI_3g13155v3 [Brachypodium distachyon]|uniref:Uncharacterized protein n=1 Tax=Brachypodium distachyon TaxID=15368 RepID=A0A2K2CWU4_BRADI|nr:hypothetical protein BRADI_3g13155v3 [Brachypodium distachyon]
MRRSGTPASASLTCCRGSPRTSPASSPSPPARSSSPPAASRSTGRSSKTQIGDNADQEREMAAVTIYKERCIAVNDGDSWAKYMAISGSAEDEHDVNTLQYTEEGLLTIDVNGDGHAAAFGDDIAIECLATEFKREVFVGLACFSRLCCTMSRLACFSRLCCTCVP